MLLSGSSGLFKKPLTSEEFLSDATLSNGICEGRLVQALSCFGFSKRVPSGQGAGCRSEMNAQGATKAD